MPDMPPNPNGDFETNYRTKHKTISIVKSGIRIAGCLIAALFLPNVYWAIVAIGLSFAVAEVLGIAEEMI
jgi:hypothetical protein